MEGQQVNPEKQAMVAELNGQFAKAAGSFVFDYTKCTCAELTGLRRKLKSNGGRLKVMKNALARRAVQGTAAQPLDSLFVGQVAVIITETDPVGSAKVLNGFAKEKEELKIKGAVVDGSLISAKDIEALASLPSKEQLLGKLLALMNAPATRLAQTINAPATNLARLLEAWRSKIEKTGGK